MEAWGTNHWTTPGSPFFKGSILHFLTPNSYLEPLYFSLKKLPLTFLLHVFCWWLLAFVSLKIFLSHRYLRLFSLDIQSCVDSCCCCLFPRTLKTLVALYSGLHCFWREDIQSSYYRSLYEMHFPWMTLRFSLWFQLFYFNVLSVIVFYVFILIQFYWVSWIYRFFPLDFRTLQLLFFQMFFLPISLFYFWGSSYMHVRYAYHINQYHHVGHWDSVSFLKSIFSMFLRLNNFYWGVFQYATNIWTTLPG